MTACGIPFTRLDSHSASAAERSGRIDAVLRDLEAFTE